MSHYPLHLCLLIVLALIFFIIRSLDRCLVFYLGFSCLFVLALVFFMIRAMYRCHCM